MDFGERRIGLAVSDPGDVFAVPVGTLPRASDAQAASAVTEAARERGATLLVVGCPEGAEGREGPFARRARNFARRLGEVSGLPVELHREELTSVAAEEGLRDAGVPSSRRAAARDAEAAAVILRDYLAARPSRAPRP